MRLYEFGESNGTISLEALFQDPALDIDGIVSELSIEELIFATCRGGWPGTTYMKSDKAKFMTAASYLDNICESDISTVDGVKRNPAWARLVLKSYARNISTLAKKSNIWRDIVANEKSFSMATPDAYVNALQRLFVLEDVEAWEADAVLHLRDGKYALIEFKLGSREIEEGAKHLLEIKRLVGEYNQKETQSPLREPDLLMVITGGEMAYTREDGVKVVPIGCLRD